MITLAQLIEQLLKQGKSYGDSIHNCFTSLMEVSTQLKELQDEKGDEEEAEESENDDDDEDEDSGDDDSEDYDDEVNLCSFFLYIIFYCFHKLVSLFAYKVLRLTCSLAYSIYFFLTVLILILLVCLN